MTDSDLVRFVNAQTSVYGQVVEELSEGRKRTHWMWFIFPQVAGLGRSPTAQHYAIRDLDQAKRYLADPILGAACVRRPQARVDQDNRLTVITLDRGSRSMCTSKTKRPGQLEIVRSSATVLATTGMPDSTSTLRLSR